MVDNEVDFNLDIREEKRIGIFHTCGILSHYHFYPPPMPLFALVAMFMAHSSFTLATCHCRPITKTESGVDWGTGKIRGR